MKREARDVLADAAALAEIHNAALAAEIYAIRIPSKKPIQDPTDHNLELGSPLVAIDDRKDLERANAMSPPAARRFLVSFSRRAVLLFR